MDINFIDDIKMAAHVQQKDTYQSSTKKLAYRKYLQSYYQNMLTMLDDKLEIAPCNEFINLALVNKHNDLQDRSSRGCIPKTELEIDDIVTPDSRFILVEGPPGMGKSTLCWELCRQWDTLKSLQDYEIVLQLKLREKRVQNAQSLNDIFYHRKKELSQSVVDEVYECEGKGVFLILDGFDEMPSSVAQGKGSLIMELTQGICLPNATRLVTSRPSALHHKDKCFPKIHRHIKIVGFTDECKVRYAELAFKSEPEVFASFKRFIFSNPVISSLMYIPVNCAIIAQVYKDIRKSRKLMPKTMTQLYSTLIPVLMKRHMIERGEWGSEDGFDLENLPKKFSPDLERVSELACKGLCKEDIQLVFSDSDVGEGFQHLGLLSEAKEMYVCEGAKSSYSFLHLSIQEFLAAWHVKSLNPLILYLSYFKSEVYNELHLVETFIYFIAGMIGCEHLGQNVPIRCMYEAQDCSMLATNCHDTFEPKTPMDMYAFGYVLVHAPVRWNLNLEANEASLDVLVSSLEDHIQPGNRIKGSIVSVVMHSNKSIINFSLLPKYLLRSITRLNLGYDSNSIMPSGISALEYLKRIIITSHKNPTASCLYRSLKHNLNLEDLELEFSTISLEEIQELSSTISSSHTIESVNLDYRPYKSYSISDRGHEDERYLHILVEAVLFCPSMKCFSTNIPFKVPITDLLNHMEHITFDIRLFHVIRPRVSLFIWLSCIAKICSVPSIKSLRVTNAARILPKYMNICRRDYYDFLSILNDSLHHNPSMRMLDIDQSILKCFSLPHVIPHIIHEDPIIAQLNVRRSRSLCNLSSSASSPEPEVTWNAWINLFKLTPRESENKVRPTSSCPDICLLQSLHSIHRLLHKCLKCPDLFHSEGCKHYPYPNWFLYM